MFGSEGLAVTTNIASGSQDAIARVAAGTSDFALVDINALIRFHDRPNAAPIKAVFVLFNQSPYAIVARKNRGIHALSDIEGKNLGVGEGDLSIRLWPALARQNGIKIASVKQNSISAAVREPMLSAGQVDAVTGFSYLSGVNLRDRGVPAEDLAVLRFADYGCEAYGFSVIVNPAFAAAKPEAVKGFLRSVIAGTHLAIKDPGRAADEVVSRMDDGSRDLELERLDTVIRDNILTSEVKRDGIGGIDPARLERSIDQIAEDFKFQRSTARCDPLSPPACPCSAFTRASFICWAKRHGWAGFSPAPICCWPARSSPSRCCSAASSMFFPATRLRVRWLRRPRGRCWGPGRRSACLPSAAALRSHCMPTGWRTDSVRPC